MRTKILFALSLRPGLDLVDGVLCGDRREVAQRSTDGEREMASAAPGDAHVFPENRGPGLWRHRQKVDAAAALMDDGVAMRGLDILHPVGIGTKHRNQVVFARKSGDYDWIGTRAAGCAAPHF